jgi:5,10-methylenetetrahydromethanopterin reductase
LVELWLGTFPIPGRIRAVSLMAEAHGWDGLALTDSQHLNGDVFAALGIAAHTTTRIKLATAASNPATRHPAVVASAMATIQVESGGRAVLGIARGDSALAYLGQPPMPLREFERGLSLIQAYLRGQTVELNGFASPIQWIAREGVPKVPVSVAATGPRVIEIAARLADRITFSVGADPVRLRTAIDSATRARELAGLPPLSLGAYVNAVAHPDIARARELVRGRMAVYARFSTMHQSGLASLQPEDRAVAEQLAAAYDMRTHAASGGRHLATLSDEFIDRFGVVGPSERVVERLTELAELGLDHFVIVGHGRDVAPEVLEESSRRFGEEVLPRLKGRV